MEAYLKGVLGKSDGNSASVRQSEKVITCWLPKVTVISLHKIILNIAQ